MKESPLRSHFRPNDTSMSQYAEYTSEARWEEKARTIAILRSKGKDLGRDIPIAEPRRRGRRHRSRNDRPVRNNPRVLPRGEPG